MQSRPLSDSLHGSINMPEDKRIYWESEDKTSLAFSLRDQAGILQKALDVFT